MRTRSDVAHLLWVLALVWPGTACATASGSGSGISVETKADRDLLDAAKTGDPEKARSAIADGANLSQETSPPSTLRPPPPSRPSPALPLMFAANKGYTDIVRLLLDKGVPVDIRDEKSGATAMMAAAGGGKIDTVRLLLDRGANPNARSFADWSALMYAAAFGATHFPVTALLVERGAEVNAQNNLGNAPLQLVAHNSGDTDTVIFLLDKGAKIDAQARDGWTALIDAIDTNHVTAAKILIERGANVNIAAQTGWTALMAAALKNQGDVAAMLIAKGADVNATARPVVDGRPVSKSTTALEVAKNLKHVEVVKMLEQAGAKQ
jgi:ankyrin repeat protein